MGSFREWRSEEGLLQTGYQLAGGENGEIVMEGQKDSVNHIAERT